MTIESLDQPHPEGLSELQEALALRWYELGVIKFDFEKGWTLASGEWSPVYVDGRLVQSDEKAKKLSLQLVYGIAQHIPHDLIAPVPTETIFLASSYFDLTGKPQITPRLKTKGHGTGRRIDGIYTRGQRALMLEGTTTTGKSMEDAYKVMTGEDGEGLIVTDAIAMCSREQGAAELLAQYGVTLHPVMSLPQVLPFYARIDPDHISPEELQRALVSLRSVT